MKSTNVPECTRPEVRTHPHSMKQTRRNPAAEQPGASRLKTPTEVRAEFRRKGLSVRAWALRNSINPQLAYAILGGKRSCLRGDSHRAAVLLGIKDGELPEAA